MPYEALGLAKRILWHSVTSDFATGRTLEALAQSILVKSISLITHKTSVVEPVVEGMPEIETARLLLRMFSQDDLDDLSRIYADADVMRYLSGHSLTREETAGWLNYFLAGWENYGFGWWAVVLEESGELIGHCGLQFIHVTPEVEVTYGLEKGYWRMGLASEAARACLRYGFEQLQLDRIYALADPGNIGSHRVMERVGMKYDKTDYYKDDLYEGDLIYYAISRDAYRTIDSPYSLRPVAGDDTRTSFSPAFEERKREWKSAKADGAQASAGNRWD